MYRPVARVGSHVGPQVEVEREALAAALVPALKRLLARVNQRVPLQFRAFHKRLQKGSVQTGRWFESCDVPKK
jgi:hypothetical protein